MDLGEQLGREPNGDLSQQRESSHENFPMFNRGRLHLPDQEEQSMFVDQDGDDEDQQSGYPSISPEAQHQQDNEEDGPQGDHQQAGNDNPDSADGSSSDNGEDEQPGARDLIDQIEQEENDENDENEDDDDESDEISGQGRPPDSACGSCKTLRHHIAKLNRRLESKSAMIVKKTKRVTKLLEELKILRALLDTKDQTIHRLESILRHHHIDPGNGRRVRRAPNPNAGTCVTQGPWHAKLHEYFQLTPRARKSLVTWDRVWKAQYQQGNISISLALLHPDITLKKAEVLRTNNESISRREFSRDAFDTPPPRPLQVKSFDKLPEAIILRILTETLLFHGQVVHIFSRLDPYEAPANLESARRLRGRIYISNGVRASISLTRDTISPGQLLSPLCVNRKWHFFGAHVFYGSNTFAFSSFGEFGRFCKGIGPARLQRIAHLELHWQGGICDRFAEADAEKDWGRSQDYRSLPLAYLPDMSRLDTLVVHIDESRMRRRYESDAVVQFAVAATEGQPNRRRLRALRACRGWDFLHMLRNMSWIRLYDTAKLNSTYQRSLSSVTDLSSVLDLNRTCRMRSTPTRAARAQLKKLRPLYPKRSGTWQPQGDDFGLVSRAMGKPFGLRENDLDEDSGVSENGDDDYFGSDESSAEEAGDTDDTDGDDGSDDEEDGGGDEQQPRDKDIGRISGAMGKTFGLRENEPDEDSGKSESGDGNSSGSDDSGSEVAGGADDTTSADDTDGDDDTGDEDDSGDVEQRLTDEDVRRRPSRPKSENGFVSHLSSPLQRNKVIIDLDANEDDEPKAQLSRFTSGTQSHDSGVDERQPRDEDHRRYSFRLKSEGGFVSHLSSPLQREKVVIDIDADEDEEPKSRPIRFTYATQSPDLQHRRSTTSGLSGLFVTPNPEERRTESTAMNTPSPSRSPQKVVIDLTMLDSEVIFRSTSTGQSSIKRSASSEPHGPAEKKLKTDQ